MTATLLTSIGQNSVHNYSPVSDFKGTREQWAEAVAAALREPLCELGIKPTGEPRQVRIALAPLRGTLLGLCYASQKSVNGDTNLITISTDQGSPLELVHTILHELLHAFDDCKSGHRGRWKRWADIIGMKAKGHARGPLADKLVHDALAEVGAPALHVQTQSKKKSRPPSQIKFTCTGCLRHVHMPTKLAIKGDFNVQCSCCLETLQGDFTVLEGFI